MDGDHSAGGELNGARGRVSDSNSIEGNLRSRKGQINSALPFSFFKPASNVSLLFTAQGSLFPLDVEKCAQLVDARLDTFCMPLKLTHMAIAA